MNTNTQTHRRKTTMTRLLAIFRNGLMASMALFVVACDSGTSFEPSREVPFSARVGGGTPTTPTTPVTPGGGGGDGSGGLTAASSVCDSIYEGMTADGDCVLLNARDDDDNLRFADDGFTRESLCYGAGSGSEQGDPLVYDPNTGACVGAFRGCPSGEGIIRGALVGEAGTEVMRCTQPPSSTLPDTVIVTAVVGVEADDTEEEREEKAHDALDAKRAEVPNASIIHIVYVEYEADDTDEEKAAKLAAAELAAEQGNLEEVAELRRTRTTYSATTCMDAGRVLQINGERGNDFLRGVSCTDQCEDGTFLGDGSGQRNGATCYNPLACATVGGGRAERGDGACVAASAESCYGVSGDSASARYYYNGERCGQNNCGSNLEMTRTTSATTGTNACVTLGACYDTHGRIRGRSGRCVAGINLCMNSQGLGYDGDKCVSASNESCDSTVSQFYNGQCVRNDCPDGEIGDARQFGACIAESRCTDSPTAVLNTEGTICVSRQGGCRVGEGVDGTRCTTTANAATCNNAGQFIDRRGGRLGCYDSCGGLETVGGNVCMTECTTGQVYSVASLECVAIDDDVATAMTQCADVGRMINAGNNQCVETCSSDEVLDASRVRCIDVTVTRKGCLADGGRAFDPDSGACVTANATTCARIGATFASGRCQESGTSAARITHLRGSGENTDASMGSDGESSAAINQLSNAISLVTDSTATSVTVGQVGGSAAYGSGNDLILFGATTTAAMIGNRLRVLYANQPSLDAVGAAFAFNANNGLNYGSGSTISYVTPATPLTGNIVTASTTLLGRAAADFKALGAGRTGVHHAAVAGGGAGAGAVSHYASFIDSGTLAVEIVGAHHRGRNEKDIGLLALINGMVDVSDSAITNILDLKKATHSIAPAANLNVQVTRGFEPRKGTFRDGSNTVDTFEFVASSNSVRFPPTSRATLTLAAITNRQLPALYADVNLYRAIMNSGARPSQAQGNVILLDNRMAAASDTPTVLALRDPNYLRDFYNRVAPDAYDAAGFLDNTWRIDAKSDLTEGFNQDLDRYLAPGGYLTRFSNSLAPTGYFNVYADRTDNTNFVLEQDNILRVPDGSSVSLRNEDLTAAIIEGLYGRGTEIYPVDNPEGIIAKKTKVIVESDGRFTRAEVETFSRMGNKLNVIDAIIDTMKARAATGRDMDALIFAARDGNADDIGLFAGLPIYIDRIRRAEDGTVQSPLPYYLAVVAVASSSQTPCGAIARDYCIAAPGTYRYATAADATLQTATSANAAASLVAGGVALMQDIFAGQLNTAEIIARIKSTASRNFDVDGTAGNDYDRDTHGHGMLDLACATQVLTQRERCREEDPDADW